MTPTHEQALVIFARAPIPGKVKTRLLPFFTPEEACEIHAAMLGDVVERARRAVGDWAAVSVAWSEAMPAAAPLPGGVPASTQPGGDLGTRMALVVQEQLRAGFQRVAILGSDAPTLPDDHLKAAFERLRRVEVVIGPAEDGGYYLVGMTRLRPEIFMKMRWGTPEVLGVTRRRLKHAGVVFAELGPWHDVDTEADVARLWQEMLKMKQRHPEEVPPRTWSVLSRLAPGKLGGR